MTLLGSPLVSAGDRPARTGGRLVVRDSQFLTQETIVQAGGHARALSTPSLEQFKSWIGVSDEQARVNDPAPSMFAGFEESVERAAGQFLFGDSSLALRYRALIETEFAPFKALEIAIDELVILPGAELTIGGLPHVLRIGQLVIHEGGRLVLTTPVRADIGTLRKIAASERQALHG